jgi:hypothetical protein
MCPTLDLEPVAVERRVPVGVGAGMLDRRYEDENVAAGLA